MKDTAPRESFGFHHLVDEGVLCLSVRLLRDCVSLIEEVKVPRRVSEEKSEEFATFEDYFGNLPSTLLPQAKLAISASHVYLLSHRGEVGFARYCPGVAL